MSHLLLIILKVKRRETHHTHTKAVARLLSLLFVTFSQYFLEVGNAIRRWVVFFGGWFGQFLYGFHCMNVRVAFAVGVTSLWKQMRHRKQSQGTVKADSDHKIRTCCSFGGRGLFFRRIENLI